jgi:uncharacterized membrane protein YedE/YeeE
MLDRVREVSRWHFAIAVINLLCLVAAIGGYLANQGGVVGIGMAFGYFANAVAVVVSICLLLWLLSASLSGRASLVLRRHWLGIANGAVVVAIWGIVFGMARLFHF